MDKNTKDLSNKVNHEKLNTGSNIVIKDRILNGGSVVLNSGNVNFPSFFSALKKIKYNGIFIMQAYRDDEGLTIFKQQLDWIMPLLEKYEVENIL